jgi:TolB protein
MVIDARTFLLVCFVILGQTISRGCGAQETAQQKRPIVFTRTLTPRLYAINIDGSGLRRLGNGPLDINPVWSPDGRKIAFVRKSLRLPRIFVINTNGSGEAISLAATNEPYSDMMPAWSADSHMVAYQHVTAGIPRYFQATVDGSEHKEITAEEYRSRFALHPYQDGKVKVISKPGANHTAYLYRVGDDGGMIQLTYGEGEDTNPVLSPDGTQIVFLRAHPFSHVYVINPDGSGRKRLSAGPIHDDTPQWSPDGAQILFRRLSDEGGDGLYMMRPDGSALQKLPTPDLSIQNYCWSPDGKEIAFSGRSGNRNQMYRMKLDGTGLVKLTDGDDIVVAWVGATLYFYRLQAYTLAMDGSGQIQPAPDAYKRVQPMFSPDGQRVVFHSYEPGHPEPTHLYLMNRDGSGLTQLTSGEASDRNPTWSPDGTRIVFTRMEAGFVQLYIMKLDDKSVQLVTPADGIDDFARWY